MDSRVMILMGTDSLATTEVIQEVINQGNVLKTEAGRQCLIRPVTAAEVKQAFFSIPEEKSPGPDGYTSSFYRRAWHIVGEEVTKAIMDSFGKRKLLTEMNHTLIHLVPKIPVPLNVGDYRPIACCSVIYKVISKLICNRLKEVLPLLVDQAQGAFIRGRTIVDNVILCHELVRGYKRKGISPRVVMKVDIRKAYDTVSWAFLEKILVAYGFPSEFVKFIMLCVSTVKFSIMMQGTVFGYFQGRRGLRQGDPMSPYLFVLAMDYLSRSFKLLHKTPDFKFHPRCQRVGIINMCFADDLMMFCKGEEKSVCKVKERFEAFSEASGLKANLEKSQIICGGADETLQNQLLRATGYTRGDMPMRYLGVPLIASRLTVRNCQPLIEKILKRVTSWTAKYLSWAGRVLLVKAVLFGIQLYWSQIFPLPLTVVHEIDRICRLFLWSGRISGRCSASVSWKDLCIPKKEGGLGIISLGQWNVAAIFKHIWNIATKSDSLWIKWVHAYYLKTCNVWNIEAKHSSSWFWKRLISIRGLFLDAVDVAQNKWLEGKFNIKRAYEHVVEHHEEVEWANLVWGKGPVARHRVFLWLSILDRLKTRDRLSRWQNIEDQSCIFCAREEENRNHLFFECEFTKDVMKQCWLKMGLTTNKCRWIENVIWGIKVSKGKSELSCKKRALFAAIVYHVWIERNRRIFTSNYSTNRQLIERIWASIQYRFDHV